MGMLVLVEVGMVVAAEVGAVLFGVLAAGGLLVEVDFFVHLVKLELELINSFLEQVD
jgi:hypothetical protein